MDEFGPKEHEGVVECLGECFAKHDIVARSLSTCDYWKLQREWQRTYAKGLHDALGCWSDGAADWQSLQYAHAIKEARAEAAIARQTLSTFCLQGNVFALTDCYGNPVERFDQEAFGNVICLKDHL